MEYINKEMIDFWGTQYENILQKIDILENLLLKKQLSEYLVYVQDFEKMEKAIFYNKYKNIFKNLYEKDDFIENDINRYDLFIIFALKNKIVFQIDWSGEEYTGQVKKCVNQLLKNNGIEYFKWKQKNILKEITKLDIKRGEYLPWLFKNINKELEKIQYQIKFLDLVDDSYYYFVISNDEYSKTKNYENILFFDMKNYEMFLLTKTMNSKLMLYLKINLI